MELPYSLSGLTRDVPTSEPLYEGYCDSLETTIRTSGTQVELSIALKYTRVERD